MKIKRFEASSMSEALRKIKKEFGEEAVILSAKTVKKGNRLLGNKTSQQVVVTAAIDKAPATVAAVGNSEENVHPGQVSAPQENTDKQSYTKFSILKKFKPITRTGQKKVQPKIVKLMNESTDEQPSGRLQRHLTKEQGLSTKIAMDLERKIASISPSAVEMGLDLPAALTQVIDAMGVVGQQRPARGAKPRVVVMVGPSGTGKTSAVAKLAAKHVMSFREQVGIITLDNQRVAGAAELERYASILGISLVNATGKDEAASALDQMAAHDLVVVDTPGLGLDDQILREELRRSLAGFAHAEVYLLLTACMQEKVSTRIVDFFKPLNPSGLFFTNLDWVAESGMMINLAVRSGMPIAFLSDSIKVPEGIHTATAKELAALLVPEDMATEAVCGQDDLTTVHTVKRSQQAGYVANRNSDIFHHHNCKSVKRINTQNMIIFKDPAEAMGQQFKPCRMCCSELLATQTSDRPVHGYAGYRC